MLLDRERTCVHYIDCDADGHLPCCATAVSAVRTTRVIVDVDGVAGCTAETAVARHTRLTGCRATRKIGRYRHPAERADVRTLQPPSRPAPGVRGERRGPSRYRQALLSPRLVGRHQLQLQHPPQPRAVRAAPFTASAQGQTAARARAILVVVDQAARPDPRRQPRTRSRPRRPACISSSRPPARHRLRSCTRTPILGHAPLRSARRASPAAWWIEGYEMLKVFAGGHDSISIANGSRSSPTRRTSPTCRAASRSGSTTPASRPCTASCSAITASTPGAATWTRLAGTSKSSRVPLQVLVRRQKM